MKVLGGQKRGTYGELIGYETLAELSNCVVSPAGDQMTEGEGYIHGDLSKMQVLAPPGAKVEEGQMVEIRGEIYTVDFTPFDYSIGRRPAVRRHKPKVIFTASRGDVHDHLG